LMFFSLAGLWLLGQVIDNLGELAVAVRRLWRRRRIEHGKGHSEF
jgi:hypothetical protein